MYRNKLRASLVVLDLTSFPRSVQRPYRCFVYFQAVLSMKNQILFEVYINEVYIEEKLHTRNNNIHFLPYNIIPRGNIYFLQLG